MSRREHDPFAPHEEEDSMPTSSLDRWKRAGASDDELAFIAEVQEYAFTAEQAAAEDAVIAGESDGDLRDALTELRDSGFFGAVETVDESEVDGEAPEAAQDVTESSPAPDPAPKGSTVKQTPPAKS